MTLEVYFLIMSFKISIIIPTFNSAKTLAVCLQSLAKQTFRDFEVLIIDGVSIDDTVAIANNFLSGIPHLTILSEPDKGIYDAMNKGIGLSKGEWLYFLGSDDSLFDEKVLEYILNFFEADFLNNDIVFGDVIFKEWLRASKNHVDFTKFDFNKCNLNHQSMFYRSSVFETAGLYDLSYTVFSDWHFNMKCALFFKLKFKYINAIVANYSIAGASNTISDDFLEVKDDLYIHYINQLSFGDHLLFSAYHKKCSKYAKFYHKVVYFGFSLIIKILNYIISIEK